MIVYYDYGLPPLKNGHCAKKWNITKVLYQVLLYWKL